GFPSGRSFGGAPFLSDDPSVRHPDHPLRLAHDHRGVGGEDEGGAVLAVHRLPQPDDVLAGGGGEVGGGLVCKDDPRTRHQGARDGHPLALTAGELVGPVAHLLVEPDLLDDLPYASIPFLLRHPALEKQGEFDVLVNVEYGDQIEALEDESELVQAQPGEAGVVELGGCLPVDADHARGGDVDAADEVEKGGLPRARRGGDRRELSFAEGEGDSIESPDLELAEWVFL